MLQAMQEQDDVLDDIIHQMQAKRRLNANREFDRVLSERAVLLMVSKLSEE